MTAEIEESSFIFASLAEQRRVPAALWREFPHRKSNRAERSLNLPQNQRQSHLTHLARRATQQFAQGRAEEADAKGEVAVWQAKKDAEDAAAQAQSMANEKNKAAKG